jgi:predicted transcriptional regulator
MSIILLAIKPKYAEEILSGMKEYELRKGCVFKPGYRLILYVSSPIKAIVGEFTAGEVYTGSSHEVIAFIKSKRPRGISEEDIYYVTGKSCRVSAIEVINPIKYPCRVPLSEMRRCGLKNPPRSYVVLKPENPVHLAVLKLIERASTCL